MEVFDTIKHNKKLTFIGRYYKKPKPKIIP